MGILLSGKTMHGWGWVPEGEGWGVSNCCNCRGKVWESVRYRYRYTGTGTSI